MQHHLPPLSFEINALEPFISAEALSLHYNQYHLDYVTTLNQLIQGNEFENLPLEEIIRMAKGPLFHNAAQHWNHTFFWSSLSPGGGGQPKGEISGLIKGKFGTYDAFKEAFNQKALSVFGSGWTWLVDNGEGGLEVMNTSNADNPLNHGKRALLALDVWEHAYNLDYRNSRQDYLKAYWELINWDFVNQNLQEEMTFKGFGNKGHWEDRPDVQQ